jgi:hypothetical protein
LEYDEHWEDFFCGGGRGDIGCGGRVTIGGKSAHGDIGYIIQLGGNLKNGAVGDVVIYVNYAKEIQSTSKKFGYARYIAAQVSAFKPRLPTPETALVTFN